MENNQDSVMRKILTTVLLIFTGLLTFVGSNLALSNEGEATFSLLTPENITAPSPQLNDTVDFTDLRMAFAKRADFTKRCEHQPRDYANRWDQAMKAKHFQDAYDLAAKLLSECPVDARFHLRAIESLKELAGFEDKMNEHKRWWIGLTDSVLKTGDGKTPQTALETISVGEEYATLTRLGLKRGKQSLVNGSPPVDMHVVEPFSDSTKLVTIYFNPRWHFIRLSQMYN
jgi:hypothetical protein